MYIDDDKIHRGHDLHNQIQALHHFINGVVGGLPPTNHDGTLTQGTVGDLTLEPVDDKGDAFIHQVVQVREDTGHFRHHTNLSPDKKKKKILSHFFFQPITTKKNSLTDIR